MGVGVGVGVGAGAGRRPSVRLTGSLMHWLTGSPRSCRGHLRGYAGSIGYMYGIRTGSLALKETSRNSTKPSVQWRLRFLASSTTLPLDWLPCYGYTGSPYLVRRVHRVAVAEQHRLAVGASDGGFGECAVERGDSPPRHRHLDADALVVAQCAGLQFELRTRRGVA